MRAGRRDHDDQLAGCLCRCTGYAPILRAARAAEAAAVPPWMHEDLGTSGDAPPTGPEGRPRSLAGTKRAPGAARPRRAPPRPTSPPRPTRTPRARSPGSSPGERVAPALVGPGALSPTPRPGAQAAGTDAPARDPAAAGAPAEARVPAAYASVSADWGRRRPRRRAPARRTRAAAADRGPGSARARPTSWRRGTRRIPTPR